MRVDDSLTPRERQIRAELARLACIEAGGHHYTDREDCVVCGEPYPVIFDDGASHLEVWTGSGWIGHGSVSVDMREATGAWDRLGVSARSATSKLSRLTSLLS